MAALTPPAPYPLSPLFEKDFLIPDDFRASM